MQRHADARVKAGAVMTVPVSVIRLLAAGAYPGCVILAQVDLTIINLRDRQQKLLDLSQGILAKAEAETRDLSEEEASELQLAKSEFDRLERDIGIREGVMMSNQVLSTPQGRRSEPDPIAEDAPPPVRQITNAGTVTPQARANVVATGGFRNFGEFSIAVKNANPRMGKEVDPRLLRNAAASTYSQEGIGADGGFLVPPDFRNAVMSRLFDQESLIGRTDRLTSSSNTITLPVDNTTPWQTSGGVQSYWTAEGAVKTQSKISLDQASVKLHNLATLVPVTEELLEDAPALDGYLRRKVPEKMDFKLSDAILWGTGAGMPLGVMNSPALVTQAAEGGQTADTINVTNLFKMFSRMPSSSRATAIWIINSDVEPQLLGMTMAGNNYPAYLPPGGLSAAPYGTLFGRPVVTHQSAKTIGDLGDVMFVDLGQYMSVTKTGGGRDASGLRADVSIHLWFDQDLVAYRFTLRIGGQPWWAAAVSPLNGSNTQSPYVTLAAR